jgi:hypothetical protein
VWHFCKENKKLLVEGLHAKKTPAPVLVMGAGAWLADIPLH